MVPASEMKLPYGSLSRMALSQDGTQGDPTELANSLGDQEPLLGGSGRRAPDKRRVSARWMVGSVLTGLTSVALMGGALYAALDGRQQMTLPANVAGNYQFGSGQNSAVLKGDRPLAIVALEPINQRIMQVPTVTRTDDGTVIRKRPFAYASAPLAAVPAQKVSYPAFDALAIFRSSRADAAVASSDSIYSAEIESDVLMKRVPFPLGTASFDAATRISAQEAEEIVRSALPKLEVGAVEVAALPYLDPTRFDLETTDPTSPSTMDIKIVAENVTTLKLDDAFAETDRDFREEVIVVPPQQNLGLALTGLELHEPSLSEMIAALSGNLGTGPLPDGTRLRIAWEHDKTQDKKIARRIGVYRGGSHLSSVALNDDGRVVWATEPASIPATQANENRRDSQIQTVARTNLPNVYDGVHRAALSQGLNKDHAKRIVRTVAFDVDFRSTIRAKDDLEIFYSLEEGAESATEESEILYIGLTLAGVKRNYYRFRADDDGSVDYYDENGKSAKKFLLRQPVPNGKFRSGFGMRRHPISRTYKLHSGVDFSAPRGTPIISAGNGVVTQAKWYAGYGRQVIIRHANGYETSYSHMHRFARGIHPGARVAQGQIIGQVGSTGYSTGPHLHYEVIVNGRKVNPMKIRLPQGRTLKGSQLAAFKRERDRIDALLERGRGSGTQATLAALN
ncbi:MAG: M23 family metallopeptidase [Ahrensia sp.]|nr:M23 family metallopeptidase [Ahrensia sp.]